MRSSDIQFTICALLLFFSFSGFAEEDDRETSKSLVRFTENKNQWEEHVLYRAQLDGGVLFLEKDCFTYSFYDKETLHKNHDSPKENPSTASEKELKSSAISSHAFRMTFLNSLPIVSALGSRASSDYNNYYIGKDPNKWASDVKNFREVNYKDLYDGVDLQVLGNQNSLKYNFFVAPGANANNIQLHYDGLDNIQLIDGELLLTTSLNEIVEQRPYAYQLINGEKIEVACEFLLDESTVLFKFPNSYNNDYELVIDPVLIFAASSGSTADNFGASATYDSRGNLYAGGTAFDQGYPTTLGAYDITYNGVVQRGRTDVVITKYDSTGTFLYYSTYLGGANSSEVVSSMVVNAQDELLIYGATGSDDFPVTSGAYDVTFNGGVQLTFSKNGTWFFNGTDIYITKFNNAGTALLGSTFVGGTGNDGVNYNNTAEMVPTYPGTFLGTPVRFGRSDDPAVIANEVHFEYLFTSSGVNYGFIESNYDSLQYNYGDQFRGEINIDKHGNVCIASTSRSIDFPTPNGLSNSLGGMQDAVVFKMSNDLTNLQWSTYLGGLDNDAGYALAIDDSANVFVTGGTRSNDFPTTVGVLQPTYNGGIADGYITKIEEDGSTMQASSYWGTSVYDQSYFVQLDYDQDVYLLGQTEGTMPVTAAVYNNANSGQFITKVNDSLDSLIFSTVFGSGRGNPDVSPTAFLVDACQNIYMSGWGGDILTGIPIGDMPVSPDAYKSSTDGFDFYLFVLYKDAVSLAYATYFGGNQSDEHVDGGTSRFDKQGIIYQSVCAGCGGYDDFPVTPGAWPNTGADVNHSSNCNNGVFKIDFQVLADADFLLDEIDGCAPLTVSFTKEVSPGVTILWDFGGGDTTSVQNPVRTFPDPGEYKVSLSILDSISCNNADTTFQFITVYDTVITDFSYQLDTCTNEIMFSDSSKSVASITDWLWDFGDASLSNAQDTSHVYSGVGTYDVKLVSTTSDGCIDSMTQEVILLNYFASADFTSVNNLCDYSVSFFNTVSSNQIDWEWSFGDGSTSILESPIHPYLDSGTYEVQLKFTSSFGCSDSITREVFVPYLFHEVDFGYVIDTCTYQVVFSDSTRYNDVSYEPADWNWSFGDGDSLLGVQDPMHQYADSGTFDVRLIINSIDGCIDSTTQQIVLLYSSINAQFDLDLVTPCEYDFQFTDQSSPVPLAWSWSFGDDSTSIDPNPIHEYGSPDTYFVELIATTVFGCKDTSGYVLDLKNKISIDSVSIVCQGDTVQLLASGGIQYLWSPSESLNDSQIANPIATITASGTYSVDVNAIGQFGDTCWHTLTTFVEMIDTGNYAVTASTLIDTIYKGQSTTLYADYVPLSDTVKWTDSLRTTFPNEAEVLVAPNTTSTYTVSMLSAERAGCPVIDTITVYVIPCSSSIIFVPNTFTPNADTYNDILYVNGKNITDLYFAVYNRWGETVFETTDITIGWDGVYKGRPADPAVFSWYMEAKCYDGEQIKEQGNVTLIR